MIAWMKTDLFINVLPRWAAGAEWRLKKIINEESKNKDLPLEYNMNDDEFELSFHLLWKGGAMITNNTSKQSKGED